MPTILTKHNSNSFIREGAHAEHMVINQFMVCLLQIGSIVMIMIMMMLNNVMTKTLMTTTVVVVMVVVARMMVDLIRLQKVQIAKTMRPWSLVNSLWHTASCWQQHGYEDIWWIDALFFFFYLNSISPGRSHPSIQRGARPLTGDLLTNAPSPMNFEFWKLFPTLMYCLWLYLMNWYFVIVWLRWSTAWLIIFGSI